MSICQLLGCVSSLFPTISSPWTPNAIVSQNYSKEDAPYDVDGLRMNITLETGYVVLVQVEENNQLVSYMSVLTYSWQDSRLVYDPNVTGTEEVVLPTSLIWIPWLNCWNCQEGLKRGDVEKTQPHPSTVLTRGSTEGLQNRLCRRARQGPLDISFRPVEVKVFEKNTDSNDVIIAPDGTARAMFRARFDTICQVDIAAFPFDVQFCSINIDGGQARPERYILIPFVDNNTQMIIGTPEWEFTYDSYVLETIGGPSLAVIFKLKRHSDFYMCFMILPTLVITSIVLVALILPLGLNNGEKISMGISGLLGLTFLLSILVAEVPRSKNLPLIGKWLLIEMFFCVFAMVITHPVHELKKRYLLKRSCSSYAVDVAVFVVVFGAHILTSLLMFSFPNALKVAPDKPF